MTTDTASPKTPATAVLIVGHGSPRAQANEGFISLVGRIAARLDGAKVLPAFFSIARPSIDDQVAAAVAEGIGHVVLMPYFLYTGQHVSRDIPTLLDECRRRHPGLKLEVLATLEGEPALEDVVVERLSPYALAGSALPTDGAAIERRSHEIIRSRLGNLLPADAAEAAIVRRVVHSTADVTFARSLRIHPQAVAAARAALAAGKPVLCDVKMLAAGITKTAGEVICAIGDDGIADRARNAGCTRAAAAMESLASRIDGAIVAIGNAPTALWKVMEMARAGKARPAVVVGMPVGFVGARESKLALIDSGLCYVTNTSPRGGSPAAAAAVNALAMLDAAKDASNE